MSKIEKAIDRLENYNNEDWAVCFAQNGGRTFNDIEETLLQALQEKLEREQNNGWISVEDRLPDVAGQMVIAFAKSPNNDKSIFTAFIGYGNNQWYTLDTTKTRDKINNILNPIWEIIYWQPLPKPPQERE